MEYPGKILTELGDKWYGWDILSLFEGECKVEVWLHFDRQIKQFLLWILNVVEGMIGAKEQPGKTLLRFVCLLSDWMLFLPLFQLTGVLRFPGNIS